MKYLRNKYIVLIFLTIIYLILLIWQKDYAFNADLGQHIILGKIISNCGCVPTTNIFSYTYTNFPWLTNSWLAAFIFYLSYMFFGQNSLLFLKIFLISLSFIFIFRFAWKNYSRFWTFIISIILLTIFSSRFSIEPELFSYLLVSIFLLLIELYRKTSQMRFLWLLIPVELFWINFHIYFIFGIAIFGSFILEQLFKKRLNKETIFLFIFLIMSTLINPFGYRGAMYPFTLFSNYGGLVEENLSILTYLRLLNNFISPFLVAIYLYFLTTCVLVISYIYLIQKKQKISIYYVCLSIVGIIAGEKMIRLLPIFIFLSYFPLLANISSIENVLLKEYSDKKHDIQNVKYFITIILVVFAIWNVSFMAIPNLGLSFGEAYKSSVDFIQSNKIQGPMFNDYNNGAYLTYRLYPDQKVFIDGRNEAFPKTFMNHYGYIMLTNPKAFDNLDKQYHFNYIIEYYAPGITSTLINYLLIDKSKTWIPVYFDKNRNIIFLRNNKENRNMISKYNISQYLRVTQ